MLVFCTVLHGFARFLHVEQLFFHDTNSLHDMWNSLHVLLHTNSFFCMTRTACTVLDGFARFCTVLHGFARFLHGMWLNPVPLPLFFPVRPYVGSSWRTWRSGGGAVPSGHLGKRAEQAQCRAGTSN